MGNGDLDLGSLDVDLGFLDALQAADSLEVDGVTLEVSL